MAYETIVFDCVLIALKMESRNKSFVVFMYYDCERLLEPLTSIQAKNRTKHTQNPVIIRVFPSLEMLGLLFSFRKQEEAVHKESILGNLLVARFLLVDGNRGKADQTTCFCFF